MKNNKINQVTPKKHRFNIIDGIILVLVLILAVGMFLYFDPFGWYKVEAVEEEVTILYTLKLSSLEKDHSESLDIGDDVNLMDMKLCSIVDLHKTQYMRWNLSASDSTMILIRNQEKDTAYITLEFECTYVEGVGYFLKEQQLLVGERVDLKFSTFVTVGECVGILVKK